MHVQLNASSSITQAGLRARIMAAACDRRCAAASTPPACWFSRFVCLLVRACCCRVVGAVDRRNSTTKQHASGGARPRKLIVRRPTSPGFHRAEDGCAHRHDKSQPGSASPPPTSRTCLNSTCSRWCRGTCGSRPCMNASPRRQSAALGVHLRGPPVALVAFIHQRSGFRGAHRGVAVLGL